MYLAHEPRCKWIYYSTFCDPLQNRTGHSGYANDCNLYLWIFRTEFVLFNVSKAYGESSATQAQRGSRQSFLINRQEFRFGLHCFYILMSVWLRPLKTVRGIPSDADRGHTYTANNLMFILMALVLQCCWTVLCWVTVLLSGVSNIWVSPHW